MPKDVNLLPESKKYIEDYKAGKVDKDLPFDVSKLQGDWKDEDVLQSPEGKLLKGLVTQDPMKSFNNDFNVIHKRFDKNSAISALYENLQDDNSVTSKAYNRSKFEYKGDPDTDEGQLKEAQAKKNYAEHIANMYGNNIKDTYVTKPVQQERLKISESEQSQKLDKQYTLVQDTKPENYTNMIPDNSGAEIAWAHPVENVITPRGGNEKEVAVRISGAKAVSPNSGKDTDEKVPEGKYEFLKGFYDPTLKRDFAVVKETKGQKVNVAGKEVTQDPQVYTIGINPKDKQWQDLFSNHVKDYKEYKPSNEAKPTEKGSKVSSLPQ